MDARRLQRGCLYLGGGLGPLGGAMVAPLLLPLARSFDTDVGTAGLSLTAYLAPFALLQLVSGTLGERLGRRRTVRLAYLTYVVASLLCAVAPGIEWFLAGRVLAGVANAFTTPLLLAGLADVTPSARLGRSIGLYSSVQAAGMAGAPLLGGLSTTVSWRWAFVGVAVVAALLTLMPPPGAPRPGAGAPRFRSLVTLRMALISFAAMTSFLGASGLTFLVALYAQRRLDVSDAATGTMVVGFGVMAMATSGLWGTLCQRFGAARMGTVGMFASAPLMATISTTDSVATLTAVWSATGATAALANVALQHLAAAEIPTNRGGATSVSSAFRFVGSAAAPLLYLPLYPPEPPHHPQGAAAFLAAAAITALSGLTLAALHARRHDRGPGAG